MVAVVLSIMMAISLLLLSPSLIAIQQLATSYPLSRMKNKKIMTHLGGLFTMLEVVILRFFLKPVSIETMRSLMAVASIT